ncbi:ent-copalyl diphosphate synthase 1-like [Rhododendron vialii]|uniref:ent-copalyl diphosphate synthase 1-like n=1 Tax=Rhododendron vialii TaxID=182163 RepID=UPI00265EF531|nr:ent-copalyl diphosphate synthase 1-like [Rhododendron vialii]
MSSQTSTLLHRGRSPANISGATALFSPAKQPTSIPFFSVRSVGIKEERNLGVRLRCKIASKPTTEEYKDVSQNGLPFIKVNGIVENETQVEEALEKDREYERIKQHADAIRSMLGSMGDGEISVSAYDTAWVALLEDKEGSGAPQFPSSLQWIANNQHQDGSWGDSSIFEAHDRIISTLVCVIALKSWNIHPDKSEKGLSFIKENINKLEDEDAEHMPIGFEVAFPSLIERARKLDIQVPDDSDPILQEIYARRNLKLTRIPKDIMHKVATTLLHSLEGLMHGLEWEKLLKLQCPDGSFLFSPSSTAFALMETKDDNCLRYLTTAVQKFNGGVPNVYPVDLFERMWAVDRLERLGISRYFKSEIRECVDYVHRYWTEEGICWARNSVVHDIDDTSMGFRLLRLHGYPVSADVFGHFKKGDEFFCFAGQSTQAVTGMYNLYRGSQISFPGEKILEDANKFSSKFLREKQARNELLDKWVITKDLPGEVGYALDVPWYANLPRVEARFYLEHYGGEDDVWIGKTLYRMPYVNNNRYLELAKLDYNKCQALHQQEWNSIQKWYAAECKFGIGIVGQRSLLLAYYLATASIFEPERSIERMAWAKAATLVEAIVAYFQKEGSSSEQRGAFIREFKNLGGQVDYANNRRQVYVALIVEYEHGLVGILLRTINKLSLDTLVVHGRDIRHHLHCTWESWMLKWEGRGDMYKGEAELLVSCINLCAKASLPVLLVSNPQYRRLSDITNGVCHQLRPQFQPNHKVRDKNDCNTTIQIESDMQELVQSVLCSSPDDIDPEIKQTFLAVAKSYYYNSHCTPVTIHFHIAKVLFERVI